MNSGCTWDREFWMRQSNRLSKCYEGLARRIGACNTHLYITLCHKLSKKLLFRSLLLIFLTFSSHLRIVESNETEI